MTHSIRLGKLMGIPIELDYTWFIVFVLLAVTLGGFLFPEEISRVSLGLRIVLVLLATLLFFASIVIHEFSHSYVARLNGIEIASITLFIFGGVARMTSEPKSAGAELKVAAAGPAASIGLSVVFFSLSLLAGASGLEASLGVVFQYLAMVNLMLAGFNLMPGFPLDGGRILRAVIWQSTGSMSYATRIASGFGQGLGYLLIAGGLVAFLWPGGRFMVAGIWFLFLGWFLVQAARSSYIQMLLRQALSGIPVERLMSREIVTVPSNLSLQDLVNDYFLTYQYGAFPVLDEGQLRGMVSLKEVRQIPREQWAFTPVSQVLQPLSADQTVKPWEDAWDAMAKMATEEPGRLMVVDEQGALLGMMSKSDLMHLIRTKLDLGL